MSMVVDNKEEEQKKVSFKVITGGKEPPKFGKNWIRDLGEGAVFIAQPKRVSGVPDSWSAFEYHLQYKGEQAALLILVQWDGQTEKVSKHWVVINDFCSKWECVEVLDGGTSSRPYPVEGLGGNENDNGTERNISVDEDAR